MRMLKWFIYNALFFVAYLAMMPAFLLRMKRRGGYRARMGDRFGRYPDDVRRRLDEFAKDGAIWVHAVSVGEVQVAAQLMEEMRRTSPDVRFVFSTTSSTGWKTAEKLLDPRDVLIYNPLDFNGCVKRALGVVRPHAVILTETEIWPNFIRALKRRGVPLYLVNARVSDRSAPRYKALRWFFSEVLRCFTRIFAQSDLDAERLIAAGADPAAVEVTGSFKFDVAKRNPAKERELREWIGEGDVLLGGSTWPGEDSMMLRTYAELVKTRPDVKLVIAPRHFEKADAVEANILSAGFKVIRRSRCSSPNSQSPISNTDSQLPVYLCDTTGEMMGLFGIAKVAFVGKSLCAHGSQNMIEPCLCGVPTVVGPYTENFRPVMSDLLAADALVQTPDAPTPEGREAAVVAAILKFFSEPEYARGFAERATAAVERRRGVTGRVAGWLLAELKSASRGSATAAFDNADVIGGKKGPTAVWLTTRIPVKQLVAVVVLVYALAALFGTQPLKHSWKYLQMNPNRRYSTFVGLSAASLALPWCIPDARRAYAGITAPVEWPGVDEEGVMRYRSTDALKGLIPAIFPGKESLVFNARLRSMAELRRLHWRCVEKWGGYRLWCIGRWDYVLVAKFPMGDDTPFAGPVKAESGDVVSADELFAEFSAKFEDFSAAGIYSPAQVFACYVGDDMEVGPALMASTSFPRWDAFWSGALPGRLAFKPVPSGGRAAVRASRITPEKQPSMDWLKRGKSDAAVYLDFLDSVAAAQDARRNVLVGFDVADAGGAAATNAIALWTAAAKVNPRDPILMNLADTFDQQGRRFLAIGNVKGAMNCYENRILVQPHDVAAVHNFGICLKRGGHFDDAAKIFMKAAKMTSDNEPHLLEFADCAAAAQHHEDAIKVLETLKKKRPDDRELDRRISKIKSALYRKNIKEYYK